MRLGVKWIVGFVALTVIGVCVLLCLPPDAAQLFAVIAILFAATLKARPQPVLR